MAGRFLGIGRELLAKPVVTLLFLFDIGRLFIGRYLLPFELVIRILSG
jgi:hypothetical protein